MRRYKVIKTLGFIVVCCVLTGLLNFGLLQYNIARVNVHRIMTQKYDDIFVGTSHGLSAINPEIVDQVTGRKSTNICMPDEHIIDSYFLVKEACRFHKPKRIIYELDPSYWSTKQNDGVNSVYIYKELPLSKVKMEYFNQKIKNMDARVTLVPWFYYRNKIPQFFNTLKMKLSEPYKNYDVEPLNSGAQQYTKEGYMYQVADPNADKGSPNIILWNRDKILEVEKKYFFKLVNFCKGKGIEFVVITTPVPQETLELHSQTFKKSHEYYKKMMEKHKIPFYDFNFINLNGFNRSIKGYLDYEGHMSGKLGNEFSKRLGGFLQSEGAFDR